MLLEVAAHHVEHVVGEDLGVIGRVGDLCMLTVVGIVLIIGLVVGVCVCACLGCCCFAAFQTSTSSWPQRQPPQATVALAVETAQSYEKA